VVIFRLAATDNAEAKNLIGKIKLASSRYKLAIAPGPTRMTKLLKELQAVARRDYRPDRKEYWPKANLKTTGILTS